MNTNNPLYDQLFQEFQGNKVNVDRFEQHLKQQCGYHYDANLFGQLIELSMDQDCVDLGTFVNSYQETQDTLQFRLDMIANRLKELKAVQQQIGDQFKSDNSPQSHLLIQVMEATGVEQISASINLLVEIQCGTQQFKTRAIKSLNPVWSESFDFTISDSSKELVFMMHDLCRDEHSQIIGCIRFHIDELKESKLRDVSLNLTRQDSIKIKTKLHVILKYVHSQESLLKQELQKVNEEITNLSVENKENQQALFSLQKPFKNCGALIKSKQLPAALVIQEFEYKYVDFLINAADGIISDWIGLFYKVTAVFITILLINSLFKAVFMDLTLLSCLLLLMLLKEIQQKHLRALLFLFVTQFVNDFIWLCIFSGQSDQYKNKSEHKLDQFAVAISYMVFIVRIPFTMLLWRNSIEYQEFEEYVQQ